MLPRMRHYDCLECGADYGVIELKVPAGARLAVHCLHCGSAFPETHGALLQFTLLKRPNQETLEELSVFREPQPK
jgi:DNA-directed RNA polymerase subunit RPC12/RpoP